MSLPGNTQQQPNESDIAKLLIGIAAQYPAELAEDQRQDLERVAFNIGLVVSRKGRKIAICDLGGGIGLFSLGCADLGMEVILVDDFCDPVNFTKLGQEVLDRLHKPRRVSIVHADLVAGEFSFRPNSLDVITSFDAMEHLHHSPKAVFHKLLNALRPGGLFLLSGPNCVNLRKRVEAALGMTEWSAMEDWYDSPVFRGHVREPNLGDLSYIARDLGLRNVSVLGRNFSGYSSSGRLITWSTAVLDYPLRFFPSLCSNIYLLGYRE